MYVAYVWVHVYVCVRIYRCTCLYTCVSGCYIPAAVLTLADDQISCSKTQMLLMDAGIGYAH